MLNADDRGQYNTAKLSIFAFHHDGDDDGVSQFLFWEKGLSNLATNLVLMIDDSGGLVSMYVADDIYAERQHYNKL